MREIGVSLEAGAFHHPPIDEEDENRSLPGIVDARDEALYPR